MEYQITLICADGKYKPVSTIIDAKEDMTAEDIKYAGIMRICIQRRWDKTDLKKYNYTKVKCRKYDREKIARENAERYARLKEEKYASGEWKRPKGERK